MKSNYTLSYFVDKTESFSMLPVIEQVKLMAYFYCIVSEVDTFTSGNVRQSFVDENLTVPSNVSQFFTMLTKSATKSFVRKGERYALHREVKKELDIVYLGTQHIQHVSTTLRSLLPKLTSTEQSRFLEEAVSCFEIKCYRAALIMTWLLTVDALYEHVLNSYLAAFNNAIQVQGKYKKLSIVKKDDFSDLRESVFIEILRVAKIISGDMKKILDDALDVRNTCAHPNTIVLKETKCISIIEDLVDNIITKL